MNVNENQELVFAVKLSYLVILNPYNGESEILVHWRFLIEG